MTNRLNYSSFGLYYFIYWAMSASINQFLGIFYSGIGFDGIQIATINSIYSITGIIFSLLFGFLIDRFNNSRFFLVCFSIIGFLSVILIQHASLFAVAIIGAIGFSCCMLPPSSIIDEQLISRLGENSSRYSFFRRWGPVGFGIASVFSSFLISHLGIKAIFLLFYFFNLILMMVYLSLPLSGVTTVKKRTVVKQELKQIMTPTFVSCMLILLLWGICESSMFQFFHLLIISKGFDVSITGWFSAASMLGEYLAYWIVGKHMKKGFHRAVFIILSFSFLLMFFCSITYSENLILLFITRILAGAGFAFVWSPVTEALHRSAPKKLSVTVQECKSVMIHGFGFIIGQMICGIWYNKFSLVSAFKVMLIFPIMAIGITLLSIKSISRMS